MDYKGYFYIMSRQTGMVLDVFECNTAASTKIIVYPKKSEGTENQLWKYNSETGELESRLNGYRIAVSGERAYDGAAIINDRTNNFPNQKWHYQRDGSIQSALGKQWVLDVQGANAKAGTPVILYKRKDGGPSVNQQWDVVPYVPTTGFYIRSALNDCYLQIKDGSDKTSAHLCIGDKPEAGADLKYLKWKYNMETRAICSELNDYAIDVQGGGAANSAQIIVNPPNYGANQKWTFEKTGAIVSGLGTQWVLDDKALGGSGSPVILYTWHGGKNQQWYISETDPEMAAAMDVEVVFSQGQQGINTFRIPALVHHDGVFLAFCEARKDTYKDWGPMNIVLTRGVQQEGGGLKWSDFQTVCCVHNKRCMNPTPIVDRTNGTIHLLFGTIPPQVTEQDMIRDDVNKIRLCIVKSKDNGLNWTDPEDLTDKVLGKENPQWACFAMAPGHGIQLKSGRLVAPGNYIVKKKKSCCQCICCFKRDFLQGGVARSFVVFSDDHGETWQLGGKVPESPENLHTSECQAVEILTKDGSSSLCLNIRTLGPHARRQQSFSYNDGLTFSPGQLVDALVEPCETGLCMPNNYGGCQGSVVSASPPESNLTPPEGSEFETWVLFSNPNHLSLRENMSVKISKDGCQTWSPGLVLHKGPSAYSDLATYEEGGVVKVACLYEKGEEHPYETISLQRMSLEDVVKGTSG